MNPWIDVAITAALFAAGNVMFGHFEAGTPKWRRLLKLGALLALTGVAGSTLGHVASAALVGSAAAIGLIAHFVILRRHGINPWTAEPRDRYYALRGWTR